jgi:hypothetical protein
MLPAMGAMQMLGSLECMMMIITEGDSGSGGLWRSDGQPGLAI